MAATWIRRVALCALAVLVPLSGAFCTRLAQAQPPAAAQPSLAQEGTRIELEDEAAARRQPDRLATAAGQMIEAGLLDEAQALLDKAEEFGASPGNVRFLRAEIARRRGDLAAAAELYRAILLDEPEALRVRLELGRTYFLMGDDTKAEIQFRFALAGDLPPEVIDNVLDFLDQIRTRRLYGFTFNFALAPDTNVNAASNDRQIEINGIPFTLSDDATDNSGIGIDVRFSGRLDIPLTERLRLRQVASYRQLEYEGGAFDDRTIALRSGPVWRRGIDELSLAGTFSRRNFAGADFNKTLGGRLDYRRRLTSRIDGSLGIQAFHADHDAAKGLDGPRGEFSLAALYALTTQSFLRGTIALNREQTRDGFQRNWSLFAALGHFVELPRGFSLYAEPGIILRRFDDQDPLFQERRREMTARLDINLRNRRLDFLGFTPVVGTVLEKRFSTIDIYDFERARLTLGVTRFF